MKDPQVAIGFRTKFGWFGGTHDSGHLQMGMTLQIGRPWLYIGDISEIWMAYKWNMGFDEILMCKKCLPLANFPLAIK